MNPKGGTSSFPSIPTPIVTISAAPFVDPSTSVVHPSPDKAMGDRELVPVVDSSHLGVLGSSLLAASSCPDVLVGGNSGAIERAARGVSKKIKEGRPFTF